MDGCGTTIVEASSLWVGQWGGLSLLRLFSMGTLSHREYPIFLVVDLGIVVSVFVVGTLEVVAGMMVLSLLALWLREMWRGALSVFWDCFLVVPRGEEGVFSHRLCRQEDELVVVVAGWVGRPESVAAVAGKWWEDDGSSRFLAAAVMLPQPWDLALSLIMRNSVPLGRISSRSSAVMVVNNVVILQSNSSVMDGKKKNVGRRETRIVLFVRWEALNVVEETENVLRQSSGW